MRVSPLRCWPLLLAPWLLASRCGPDEEVVDDTKTKIDVAVRLQVAGVDPAFGTANTPYSAEVFGSSFEKGATVEVGGTPASNVKYLGSTSLTITVPPLAAGSWDVTVSNPDGTEATLRRAITLSAAASAACPKALVYFDFDSTTLSAAARSQLDAVVACARTGTMTVRVEGHCDEKGTTEYNLALGQRRADAVSRYLVGLGISPTRVQAVSYGEERLADSSGNAAADALNRRVEVNAR